MHTVPATLQPTVARCYKQDKASEAEMSFASLSRRTLYHSGCHARYEHCEHITVHTSLPLPLLRYRCFWRSVQINNA